MFYHFSLDNYALKSIGVSIILFMFVEPSLTFDNCSFHAVIERTIDNIGFHRNVDYQFSLTTNCTFTSCKLCIQEFIPRGLYVNKDQLDDLLRANKLAASVDGNIDIEAPASVAPPLILRILKELSSIEGSYLGNASLPVHMRYHDPQPGGGFRTVNMDQPELYVYCSGLPFNFSSGVYFTECAGNEKLPLPYRKIPFKMKGEPKLTMTVPVGDSDSFGLVFAGTFAVVIGGSLYLAGVMYKI